MLRKIIALGLCTLSTLGCLARNSMGDVSGATIEKYVHLDPTFSQIESTIINDSFNEWSKKTDNTVRWRFDDWPDLTNQLEVRSDIERKSSKCLKHLLILRKFSIEVFPKDDTKVTHEMTGYARNNDKQECGIESIALIMDRIRTSNELRLVTLHEIGHNLGLVHNKYASIMNNSQMHMVNGITPYDLSDFCKLWKCDAAKLIAQADESDAKAFAKTGTAGK